MLGFVGATLEVAGYENLRCNDSEEVQTEYACVNVQ